MNAVVSVNQIGGGGGLSREIGIAFSSDDIIWKGILTINPVGFDLCPFGNF